MNNCEKWEKSKQKQTHTYSSTMVVNFKVFKKCSPNGKITLYLGKRDFVDHISAVEPIGNKVMGVFNWIVYTCEWEWENVMFAQVTKGASFGTC